MPKPIRSGEKCQAFSGVPIVDALSEPNFIDCVVIDEPELSLHPSAQRRLFDQIKLAARARQLVIATHSPYFIDYESLVNGARLVRVAPTEQGTRIHKLLPETIGAFSAATTNNIFNPHTFGLEARELFFQEDGIVLLEGQEDVVLFPRVLEQLNLTLQGNLYGWGAGGATNFRQICSIFSDLGFTNVLGVLDGGMESLAASLRREFSKFHFVNLPAPDIRAKKAVESKEAKAGLLDENYIILPEFLEATRNILTSAGTYLSARSPN